MKKVIFAISILCALCAIPDNSNAEEAMDKDAEIAALKGEMRLMQEQFAKMQQEYAAMMDKMQARINELESREAPGTFAAHYMDQIETLTSRIEELESEGRGTGLEKALNTLNPQISVMGDFIYKATDEDGGEGDNDFNLREVELAFSANVDIYARADVYVAIEHEDGSTSVAIEEGYLTLLETPIPDLQGKFGKFRPYFGKANKYHLHVMPWVNYPKFVENYLGEEGFSEAGVSLSYLIPNPWDIYSELTIEGFNNGSTVLGGGETSDTMYLAHLKEFFELNDTTTLELGVSHMIGENGLTDSSHTNVSGGDVTLKWQTDNPGEYTSITSQTELLYSDREVPRGDDVGSWGMYSSLEFRPLKQWTLYGRYDYSETPTDSSAESNGYTAGLTFAQSEYAFWRVQYTHTDNELSVDTNEIWLQLDFGIGAHRAHQY